MELQKCFGDIYLGKIYLILLMISLFWKSKVNYQMDAGEFEGILYNMLSEEPFANHRFDMKDENNDTWSLLNSDEKNSFKQGKI